MRRLIATTIVLLFGACSLFAEDKQSTLEQQVQSVIQQFEQGLKERKLSSIEPLVADDMVVLENGHRNDGWQDFRDNHLIPEMKEPAPPSQSEVIRVVATADMAWAYTKTEMTLTRKTGDKAQALLWSVYILEKRGGRWKIALLDWSVRVERPAKS